MRYRCGVGCWYRQLGSTVEANDQTLSQALSDASGNFTVTAQAQGNLNYFLRIDPPADSGYGTETILLQVDLNSGSVVDIRVGYLPLVNKASATPTSIVVSPSSATVINGNTQQFQAIVYDNSNIMDKCQVGWRVEGGIGSIDVNGMFTATKTGTGNVVAYVGSSNGQNIEGITIVQVQVGWSPNGFQTGQDTWFVDGMVNHGPDKWLLNFSQTAGRDAYLWPSLITNAISSPYQSSTHDCIVVFGKCAALPNGHVAYYTPRHGGFVGKGSFYTSDTNPIDINNATPVNSIADQVDFPFPSGIQIYNEYWYKISGSADPANDILWYVYKYLRETGTAYPIIAFLEQ